MLYYIVSAICLAALVLIALGYIIAIIFKGREARIDFIRKFKKGNCILVYIVAIPLYFIANFFTGSDWLHSFFTAVNQALSLVILRYDFEDIDPLLQANSLYEFTIYVCFIMVAINAMLLTFSIISQRLWTLSVKYRFALHGREKLLIVGNNSQNINIYKSEKKRRCVIVDKISEKDGTPLYAKKINYISKYNVKEYCVSAMMAAARSGRQSFVVVINTGDDDLNISICQAIADAYTAYKNSPKVPYIYKLLARVFPSLKDENDKMPAPRPDEIHDLHTRFRVYAFGMPRHEAIYEQMSDSTEGCIRYVNKYRRIAMDFVDKYPLTEFLTDEQVDFKTSLIKPDVDINVSMVGFGRTNQHIFTTSVANNQFMTSGDDKPVLKQVRYHIFDKEAPKKSKNLNHTYYRFENEFADERKTQVEIYARMKVLDKLIEENRATEDEIAERASLRSEYFEFPALPADTLDHEQIDVDRDIFYEKLRGILTKNPKDMNYVIIAFGTDLQNVDMAQRLYEKKLEWKVKNMYIFVKVRSGNRAYSVFKNPGCILIGDEPNIVYNINEIDDSSLVKMAMMRDISYNLEKLAKSSAGKQINPKDIEDIMTSARDNWYREKNQRERNSNLFDCISMRSKLQLMKLDYCKLPKKEDEKKSRRGKNVPHVTVDTGKHFLTEDEYLKAYANADMPKTKPYSILYESLDENGNQVMRKRKIYDYDIDFDMTSRRTNMAIQEHYRWNAFMITQGFVPSSLADVEAGNTKNYQTRCHANITTFDGLIEFRKLLVKCGFKKDERSADVICYDYQILDYAFWFLSENGYGIYERQ